MKTEKIKGDGYSVRSVERAIAILQCFSSEEDLRLNQICERVNLPKSTVHRLLSSLEQEHMIEQDLETGKYFLGCEVIRLGQMARLSKAVSRIAHPELSIVANKSGQTCNLYIKQGYGRLCIDQVEGSQYIRRHSYMGALHPLHCGASGRVLLAYSSEEFQKDFFENAPIDQITEKTIIDRDVLKELCQKIKRDGYAASLGERDCFSGSVAVPIFSSSGQTVAAITISGHLSIFTEKNIEEFVAILKESSARLTPKFR